MVSRLDDPQRLELPARLERGGHRLRQRRAVRRGVQHEVVIDPRLLRLGGGGLAAAASDHDGWPPGPAGHHGAQIDEPVAEARLLGPDGEVERAAIQRGRQLVAGGDLLELDAWSAHLCLDELPDLGGPVDEQYSARHHAATCHRALNRRR